MSDLRASQVREDAHRSLCLLLRVRRLRCDFEAEGGGLLRLLFVRRQAMSLRAGFYGMSRLINIAVEPRLTSKSARRTIVLMRSWQRGILAAIVLVAFCGSAWATCAEGAIASQTEQMACCKAGHDHCPMKDSASDCCKQSGPQYQSQATITKATSAPHAPVDGLGVGDRSPHSRLLRRFSPASCSIRRRQTPESARPRTSSFQLS